MTCTYCGVEYAGHTLDGDAICYDCYTRLQGTPADERKAKLLGDLQLVHATVLRMPPSSAIRADWLTELSDRVAWARVAKFGITPETIFEGAELPVPVAQSVEVSVWIAEPAPAPAPVSVPVAISVRVAAPVEAVKRGGVKVRKRA